LKRIPVFDAAGRQLAACHPARARELLRRGKATAFRNKNRIFCLRLTYNVEAVDDERN